MPAKKRRAARTTPTAHDFSVTSTYVWTSVRREEQRGDLSYIDYSTSVELRGSLAAPMRDSRDIRVTIYLSDPQAFERQVKALGTVAFGVNAERTLRHVEVVLFWPPVAFDRLQRQALAGHIKHGYMRIAPVKYRGGLVTDISFATEPIE